MKKINRIAAVILSGVIVSGAVFCSGCNSTTDADNEPTNDTYSPSSDEETTLTATDKEEVLYVNLDASGAIKDAYVVNIVGGGKTVDYGDYEWVKVLNTSDEITQEGDQITVNCSGDRVYYEGKLKQVELPWNISIRYFIDGTEYSAEQVAGKSGKLEIKFSVAKNEKHTGNFFESYALQASFTLNTQKCKNLSAPDATVANVGKNKQISYTLLPGKGIDTSITADVTEFEMSAVSINGVPMSMGMEIDDSELVDKIVELQDAVSRASDGANQLAEGLDELLANNTSLTDGTNELKDGLAELKDNNQTLIDGTRQAYEGLCISVQEVLNARLAENGLGELTLTPENYAEQLAQVVAQLDETLVREQAEQVARSTVTAQVENNADALYMGYLKESENEIYAQYVKSIENDIYSQYINENADSIYYVYVKGQNDANSDVLYKSFAYQYVYQQALASGLSEEQATAYVTSEAGQLEIMGVYTSLTDDQKTAIIWGAVDELTYKQMKTILSGALSGLDEMQKQAILEGAVNSLTSLQKQEILAGAVATLTDEQKAQIRSGYIEQLMASEEVAQQIEGAVSDANEAKTQIETLKFQLDEFGTLYNGIVEYTDGVMQAYDGAEELADGLTDYTDGVSQAEDGANELNDGL
ncbi:MAG: hypothetical protein ACI4QI_05645, partial [Candidatus Coproplasma sp.]